MSTAKKSFRDMTLAAIVSLKERSGSSVPAIVKYIAQTYGIDMDKRKIHLKRYLKKAVSEGELIQTKGTGFNGSFKLSKIQIKTKSKPNDEKISEKMPPDENMPPKKTGVRKLGPKISADVQAELPKNATKKKTENKRNGKKAKDTAKTNVLKVKKDANGRVAKPNLKRASLIGGALNRNTPKKTASKKQLKEKIQSNLKK